MVPLTASKVPDKGLQTKETTGGRSGGRGETTQGRQTSHTFPGTYNYSGCTPYSGIKSQTLPFTNPTQSDVNTLDPIHTWPVRHILNQYTNLGLLLRLFKPKVYERLL